ncbi:MAG: DNA-directed RNA polymerase subunit alpha [Candidatus Electryonea clarkiae]|nr:DNA-directed RNA polymerase subunit alpha [Candidatus Electryonea clarkiae]MDP8288599.1 DNA-directed RNA polymerase subunit alpha [Candidatus Electryonea clarkiae]
MSTLNFQMPETIELDEGTYCATYGKFIIHPLERGFGVTIGNSLRRVLLASLQGAAITLIKIDADPSVLHEFTTIPGVSEDMAEVVLNLKEVRLKLLNKRPAKVSIKLKGAGAFTASDLQKNNTDFEVLNPDHHIATMNDDAEFGLELTIRRGRGYVMADDNRDPNAPIGTIPIDSIFSPVRNVTFRVENTRVGQRTDYEKLILEIWTDGSITPDDALSQAARILRDHIQLFINFDSAAEEETEQEIDEEILRVRKLLKQPVKMLDLSVRSANCLRDAEILIVADLVRFSEEDLLKFKNFGRKSYIELADVLHTKGLEFGMDVDKYLGEAALEERQ